jgi:MoaA/NifB/PqqE/SkfB family radical SAM enzyme
MVFHTDKSQCYNAGVDILMKAHRMDFRRIIQVEVTTICQAHCTFCPRTLLKEKWISKNIDWKDLTPLLAGIKKDTLVHLQGWGEPLLHPRLWDMAAAVRQRKGKVSLTTNGMLMDKAISHEIVKTGLEFVAFSLADSDPVTHDILRAGTALDHISENIQYLCSLKNRPRVHIAVQMMKSNLENLPKMVQLAARLGADRVIASNLDCVISPEIEALKVFDETPNQQSEEIAAEARRLGHELKIEVETYPLYFQHGIPVCRADPLHTTVVTVNGELAPCVYLSLPVHGDIQRIFKGNKETVPRFVYGKTADGIERCQQIEPARSFLKAFSRRKRLAMVRSAGNIALLAMPRLRSTDRGFLEPASRLEGTQALPPAPVPCQHCYKLYGI